MRLGKLAALVVPLAATAVLFTTAAASPAATPAAPQDYCTAQAKAHAHSGGWVCIDPGKSRARMQERMKGPHPKDVPSSSSFTKTAYTPPTSTAPADIDAVPIAYAAGDGQYGWCSASGCWYLWRETPYAHSEFDALGSYWYGSTPLGNIDLYIVDWLPNNSNVKVNNQEKISPRGQRWNSWWDTLQLVTPTYPAGKSCGSSISQPGGPSAPGGKWLWNGKYLATCIYSTQTVEHIIKWQDWSFPGTWGFVAKSAKFTHEAGYAPHFQGDWDTPYGPSSPAYALAWTP